MSGGHFDYQQYRIEEIAEHLEKDIADIEFAKEMMEHPEYPAPELIINDKVKDFYDFKVEDFALDNYQFTPMPKKLEVAI